MVKVKIFKKKATNKSFNLQMFNNKQIKHKINQKIIQINLNKIKIYIIQFKNKMLNNLQLIDKCFLMIFLI